MSNLKFDLSKITEESALNTIAINSNSNIFSYKLSFRFFVYEHSRTIRNIIRALLKDSLSKININKINLIIDELINNVIEYSNNELNIIKININLKKDNTIIIKIRVLDSWNKDKIKAKDILSKEKYLNSNSNNNKNIYKLRWRWLFCIVKKISNNFKIKDNKKWWISVISKIKIFSI